MSFDGTNNFPETGNAHGLNYKKNGQMKWDAPTAFSIPLTLMLRSTPLISCWDYCMATVTLQKPWRSRPVPGRIPIAIHRQHAEYWARYWVMKKFLPIANYV